MNNKAFTLIELSIVLVIIGLIVGGVLTGRDLIKSAEIRSQIGQIEKYQTAVNTFKSKYSHLPGDIPEPSASGFGFVARGPYAGMGDGNGLLEGIVFYGVGSNYGLGQGAGENPVFWRDLSYANLIDATFSAASPTTAVASDVTGENIKNYFPSAKIGNGSFIYVYGDSYFNVNSGAWVNKGLAYFGLSAVTTIKEPSSYGVLLSNPSLSVLDAFSIDTKIDDGLPQFGRIIARYLNQISLYPLWAAGGGAVGDSQLDAYRSPVSTGSGIATPATSTTCYDNNNVVDATEKYSTSINSGLGINCALSFRIQ